MYKVRIVPPTSERKIEKRVSVEDIAHLMSKVKKKRGQNKKKSEN